MKKVGVLYHPKIEGATRLAKEIASTLHNGFGCEPWLGNAWDETAVREQAAALELLITLGGDGTILRAARAAACYNTPILGVKMGRLGFLAEVQPDAWRAPLNKLFSGEYWLEERMMLTVQTWRQHQEGESKKTSMAESFDSLNDIVVSRGNLARVIRVAAHLDGGYLCTYLADGVIVSTATGSTAYALAVGGPILPPELRNILMLPIAPHLSMDRALVLSEGSTVSLQVFTDHTAILTVDGQFQVELGSDDRVEVKASPHRASFLRIRDRTYFYQTLMDRLRWTV